MRLSFGKSSSNNSRNGAQRNDGIFSRYSGNRKIAFLERRFVFARNECLVLVSITVLSGEPIGKLFREFSPVPTAKPVNVMSYFVNQYISQVKHFEIPFVKFNDCMLSLLSANGTGSNVFLNPMRTTATGKPHHFSRKSVEHNHCIAMIPSETKIAPTNALFLFFRSAKKYNPGQSNEKFKRHRRKGFFNITYRVRTKERLMERSFQNLDFNLFGQNNFRRRFLSVPNLRNFSEVRIISRPVRTF